MSNSRPKIMLPAAGALSVAAIATALAGCGSSSPSYGGSSNPTGSMSSGDQQTIGTASGSMGTYLTAENGLAVYMWEGDHPNASNCNAGCSSVWPPVTTGGAPKASGSAVAADLGTIHRSDGKTQVTYMGHPLYYYVSDTSSGQTTGQGNNGFGAKWWLVAPAGTAMMGSGSAPSSAPSSSGSGGGW